MSPQPTDSSSVSFRPLAAVAQISQLPLETSNLISGAKALARVVWAGYTVNSPLLLRSIFGPISSWAPPYRPSSELNVVAPTDIRRALRYLLEVSVPAFSHEPHQIIDKLVPDPLQEIIWRPSFTFDYPQPEVTGDYPEECWFYINGVATNLSVAQMNIKVLQEMFRRPITGIYNATNSLLLDLIECAVDKRFKRSPDLDDPTTMTAPAMVAAKAILPMLQDDNVRRVVVIAHSQGTIVAANVVRALITELQKVKAGDLHSPHPAAAAAVADVAASGAAAPVGNAATAGLTQTTAPGGASTTALGEVTRQILLTPQESKPGKHQECLICALKKLEIYMFANCADELAFTAETNPRNGEPIALPFIENFANEQDLVARFGILSPLRKLPMNLVRLSGALFLGHNTWGHFLNAHYLQAIQDYLSGQRADDPYLISSHFDPLDGEVKHPRSALKPRLYEYFGGATPDKVFE